MKFTKQKDQNSFQFRKSSTISENEFNTAKLRVISAQSTMSWTTFGRSPHFGLNDNRSTKEYCTVPFIQSCLFFWNAEDGDRIRYKSMVFWRWWSTVMLRRYKKCGWNKNIKMKLTKQKSKFILWFQLSIWIQKYRHSRKQKQHWNTKIIQFLKFVVRMLPVDHVMNHLGQITTFWPKCQSIH